MGAATDIVPTLLDCAALSDIGSVRTRNEDSLAWDVRLGVFVLADGMGGHRAGDVASRLATEGILVALRDELPMQAPRRVLTAITRLNTEIFDLATHRPEFAGMGTTVIAIALQGTLLCAGHVGDSRLYRWREGRLERLTRDHTVAEEWLGSGHDTPPVGAGAGILQQLTRALGATPDVEVDYAEHEIRRGDRFLLCTDGLTRAIDDAELARWIAAPLSADLRVRSLIDLANQRGGQDNASAIALDF